MRKERVILENGVDRPAIRGPVSHRLPFDEDLTRGWQLEAADHAQRRRLAATGRSQQRQELALAHVERDAVDRPHLAEGLEDVPQFDAGSSQKPGKRWG